MKPSESRTVQPRSDSDSDAKVDVAATVRAVGKSAVDDRIGLMVALLILTGGLWLFTMVAEAIADDRAAAIDERILLAFREPADRADPLGPPWLEEIGRDVTALGGYAVLSLLVSVAFLRMLIAGRRRAAVFLLVAVLGAFLTTRVAKTGFERPRPDLVPHGSYVVSASFPSGHSSMSAVVYLTLGVLLARFEQRRRLKVFVLAVAVMVTLLVGVSRVYLGVHWPSDVLGGWTVGTAWALASWLVARWLQQRGDIEHPRTISAS